MFSPTSLMAQKKAKKATVSVLERPKLVVGIVVDQMRYDYLYRYCNKYSDGGFKRLMQQGFNYRNTHYNYVPTATAPGHASVYTGTTPARHGIIGNNWYVRETGKSIYCTDDLTVQGVGTTSDAGKMSPANMLATTITDELKIATNQEAKVIGVSLKDRGSILPAGHAADAAYWFDSAVKGFITSTFYMKQLPAWVQQFNSRNLPDSYVKNPWTTLLPIAQYTESTPDDNNFENTFSGQARPVFPHNLPELLAKNPDILRTTPFGNTLTKEFAIETIKAEKMGQGKTTDFLALSFSSTDYVGHHFGPNSIEVEDTYLRLDQDLADFLKFLDSQVGKDNVLIFLTADHAAANNVGYLNSLRIPSNSESPRVMQDSLKQYLNKQYGVGNWVESYSNQQVYLNRKLIQSKKVNLSEIQQKVADYLLQFNGIQRTTTATTILQANWTSGLLGFVLNGYSPKRSGDVIVTLQPGWIEGNSGKLSKGTTHGTSASYDTHVPLLWYGWKVKPGESAHLASITDIAPTVAYALSIQEPNACTGQPLQEVLRFQ
ncbi:alkaline phosphatase family protein [Adhaeribacter swui]|uniref:Alkaline phosphatase family protein n=2 Tax=Adhaeribacter swui TaxID=2086471 RepID=A0A7G7GF16_9BACT|nr:alkaline phosphatase family protein [Adhaeribacter swui]